MGRIRIASLITLCVSSAACAGPTRAQVEADSATSKPKDQKPAMPETYSLADLLSIKRVSDVQLAPDGQRVAYAVKTPNLEKNSFTSHIWIVGADGSGAQQLTNHEKGESRPRWSPEGTSIAFLSSRGGDGPQIWIIPVDGGEARQVTKLSTGASDHVWSPKGDRLAFTSQVWPDLEGGDAAQKKRADEIEASGVKAQVLDRLLFRHWNEWTGGKRQHLFAVEASGGEARDLSPGHVDVPPFSLGGPDAYAFSPDGREIAFTRGPDRSVEAISTNADLCVVPVDGGPVAVLTAENRGWDGSPAWSPDGRFIAYRSQERDGYEADRFRLALVERATGKRSYLAADLDRSIDEILWAPSGRTIHIVCEDEGRSALHAVDIDGPVQTGATRKLFAGAHLTSLTSSRDGSRLAGELQSLVRPTEGAVLELRDGRFSPPRFVTTVNDALFAAREMPSRESVRFPGANEQSVQAWLLKPPGFDATKKYPLVLFIHGGPQSAWQDSFSFRWNATLFAARGFVVLAVNPRGSTGFGQRFTEEISGDWPGACFEDLMRGVDWAIAQGFVDPNRLAAMGGSFGGYMANWILGHTDRFKALVSHAGVYNLERMYGTTEELWFPEWDLGDTPWKNGGAYEKHSPHRFAAKFRTPTLVIHGELDYRVCLSEGLQLFTALQRQGVPSRLLYFPDEGHWILKLKNSKLWNETVIEWLERYLK